MKKDIHLTQDLICAVATPQGAGARQIIRITGPNAVDLLSTLMASSLGLSGSLKKTSFPVSFPLANGRIIRANALFWRAPGSYTGQDLIEIHLANNAFLVDTLVFHLIRVGFRLAIRGEFTLRAFLSGRIDFSQVEAIFQVIEAEEPAGLQRALGKLGGGVIHPLGKLKEDLLDLLADVEAGLDFTQEDIQIVTADDVIKRLGGVLAQILNVHRKMSGRSDRQKVFRALLYGLPNAGKSALINFLAGSSKSLVSPIAGTTRDYVIARVVWGGLDIELVDTPGLEATENQIESAAQDFLQRELSYSHLVLYCCDVSMISAEWDLTIAGYAGQVLGVATKTDLGQAPMGWIATSSVLEHGFEELKNEIVSRFSAVSLAEISPMAQMESQCVLTVECLRRAHQVAIHEQPMELLALELREAIHHLGEITGQVFTDDLLDRMFSRFCVGK